MASFVNNNARPPVPAGPPPPYARVVTRVYRNSLRPVIIFVCGVSAIWSFAVAVGLFRNRDDEGETSKMAMFDLIVGILYMVTFGLEVFGVLAAFTQRLQLVKMYIYAAGVAGLIAVAASALRLAMHFVLKDDVIRQCTVANSDATVVDSHGNRVGQLTDAGAESYCKSMWNREVWWSIFWILLSLVFGFFFTCVAAAFYHQLLDPSSLRSNLAPSTQYNLQTFHPHGGPNRDPHFQPPPGHYAGEDVPPYPGYGNGPPKYEGGPNGGITPTDEKTNSGLGYAPAGGVGRTLEEGGSESTVTLEPPRGQNTQGQREQEGRL